MDELDVIFKCLGGHRRLGICSWTCLTCTRPGRDVTDRGQLDRLLDEIDSTFGLDRVRALHVNDSKTPLGSNRDRHDNILEGVMGEKLGVFLGHPALRGLPAVLEVPGPDGHGPDAAEVTKPRAARPLVDTGETAGFLRRPPSLCGRVSSRRATPGQSPGLAATGRAWRPGLGGTPWSPRAGSVPKAMTVRLCLSRPAEPARRPGRSARRRAARRTPG